MRLVRRGRCSNDEGPHFYLGGKQWDKGFNHSFVKGILQHREQPRPLVTSVPVFLWILLTLKPEYISKWIEAQGGFRQIVVSIITTSQCASVSTKKIEVKEIITGCQLRVLCWNICLLSACWTCCFLFELLSCYCFHSCPYWATFGQHIL